MKYQRTTLNQVGSSALLAFLAIAIIAAAGIVGYRVIQNNDTASNTPSSSANKSSSDSAKINSTNDVKNASKDLESTNVDSQVNTDQLDSDINAIL